MKIIEKQIWTQPNAYNCQSWKYKSLALKYQWNSQALNHTFKMVERWKGKECMYS